MKSLSPILFTLVAVFVVFTSSGCDPVCEDGQVEIDLADATAPNLVWEVTSAVMTPGGPISSIALYSDPINNVGVSADATITITLRGSDVESGIKTLDITGGFGYFCSNGSDGTIAIDGIFPGNKVTYTFSATCATEEATYPSIEIVGPDLCSGTFDQFTSGGYGLTGIGENHAGITANSQLILNIVP